jgi:hypothetical protein
MAIRILEADTMTTTYMVMLAVLRFFADLDSANFAAVIKM